MSTRKNSPTLEATETKPATKPKPTRVFISHDSQDAALAEEFNKLLTYASGGGLKAFRSSDKKGTEGIEYGLDWYPTIMEKIDEATDVVCLLTKRSVERPWILYEAGVAKGKLDKKVIGIAMGINHTVAFTGPFAQFQNNDGSAGAITKLVLDLVGSVPELNPEKSHVEELVNAFLGKAAEILQQDDETPLESAEIDTDLIAKLFEEVKIMFESLPDRLSHRIEPRGRSSRRPIHPGMLERFLVPVKGRIDVIGLSIAAGMLSEEIPWLSFLLTETYRNFNGKGITIPVVSSEIRRWETVSQLVMERGTFEMGYESREFESIAMDVPQMLLYTLRKHLQYLKAKKPERQKAKAKEAA